LIGHRLHHRLATSLLIAVSVVLIAGYPSLAAAKNGASDVGVRNGHLTFGTVPIGRTKRVPDSIVNHGSSSVTISSIQGLGSEFKLTGITLPLVLAPQQRVEFEVEFLPTAVGSPLVKISFDESNGQPYTSLLASGTAVTIGQLAPNPSPIAFENTTIGSNQTSTVTLTNTGGSDLTITAATMSGAGFAMSNLALPITIHAGKSIPATIKFVPTETGDFTGSVAFETRSAERQERVPLPFHGVGVPRAVAKGSLAATPASLAFGSVQVGSSSSQSATVTNTGQAPVILSQAAASASLTLSGLALPVTLASGQSASFKVVFSPTSSGAAGGSVTLASNASNSSLSIPVTGTALAPTSALAATPASLAFGSVQVGSNSSQSATVTNTGQSAVILSQATASGAGFTISGLALPLTLGSGQSASFKVVFSPTSSGAAGGSVTLTSNASNSSLSIPVTGTAAAPASALAASPASLAFGSVQVGSNSSQSATVTNTGQSAVILSQAAASGAGFAISGLALPLTLASGQSTSFKVVFSPTSSGAAGGSVTLTSNASNSSLSIPVTGTAPAPASSLLAASPASLAFSSTQVGGSTNLYETLTNSGASTITISKASVTGTAFSISGLGLPLTLAANQSVTFTATFAPASGGAASGTLSLLSNASNSTATVTFSGTGAAPGQLAVSPGTLSFGSVVVGSTTSLNGSVTASGSAVNITSVGISNAEFVVSGISLPMTLAAGQSATFAIAFTPQSSGAAAGSLSFASNASSATTVESMTGTGTAPIQHSVDLTWTGSSGAVGYNVYRSNVSAGPYTLISTTVDGTTAYIDNTVSAGQTYYYVTTAVNSNSTDSGYSNVAEAVIPSD